MSVIDRKGATLLEMVIAVAILSGVLITVFAVMHTGQDTFNYGVALAAAETRGRNVTDEVAVVLVDSGVSQLNPDMGAVNFCSSLEFRKCTGYSGGAVQWGPLQRVEFRQDPGDPHDGVDNDRDGLTDEGEVVWTRNVGAANEESSVLAGNVACYLEGEELNGSDDNGNGMTDERGFCFRRSGNEIVTYVTVQGWDGKFGLVEASVQTSIRLRN